jgi:hypothetical protein
MAEHSGLTGASLHESKGAAAATLGQVAVANGAGAAPFGTLLNGSLGTGMIVQVAYSTPFTTYSALAAIPFDNSIPQITEGTALSTATITPKSASNKLLIYGNAMLGGGSQEALTLALFQDATAGALCASAGYIFSDDGTNDACVSVSLLHVMDAGTTIATTFRLRAGDESSGFVNGSAARRYGGVAAANIIVVEVKV